MSRETMYGIEMAPPAVLKSLTTALEQDGRWVLEPEPGKDADRENGSVLGFRFRARYALTQLCWLSLQGTLQDVDCHSTVVKLRFRYRPNLLVLFLLVLLFLEFVLLNWDAVVWSLPQLVMGAEVHSLVYVAGILTQLVVPVLALLGIVLVPARLLSEKELELQHTLDTLFLQIGDQPDRRER